MVNIRQREMYTKYFRLPVEGHGGSMKAGFVHADLRPNISTDLYEAASIDGATKWQQFKSISVPLVKPTTIYVLTISIYAGLSMFLESYMLWKGNNSPQNIGLTIVGYLYRQGIEKRAMGYACAVGLVLLIIVMIINIIQLALTGTFKKEER